MYYGVPNQELYHGRKMLGKPVPIKDGYHSIVPAAIIRSTIFIFDLVCIKIPLKSNPNFILQKTLKFIFLGLAREIRARQLEARGSSSIRDPTKTADRLVDGGINLVMLRVESILTDVEVDS